MQKYRIFLRRVAEQGLYSMLSDRGIDSMFRQTHIKEPYVNYYTPSTSWYETSLNNRSFYSESVHGHSRLLSEAREPVRYNQMSYNYMNRSATYEPQYWIWINLDASHPKQHQFRKPTISKRRNKNRFRATRDGEQNQPNISSSWVWTTWTVSYQWS